MPSKRLIKSFAFLLAGDSLNLINSTLLSIALGRYFGISEMGIYSYGMAIGVVIFSLIDLGYGFTLTRDINRSQNKSELIRNAITNKNLFWIASIPIAIIFAIIPRDYRMFLSVLAALPWALFSAYYNSLAVSARANFSFSMVSRINGGTSFLSAIFSFLAAYLLNDILIVPIILAAFELFKAEFLKYKLQNTFPDLGNYWNYWNFKFQYSKYRNLYKSVGLSYFNSRMQVLLVNIISSAKQRAPLILLGLISDSKELGIYSASQRFITAGFTIPGSAFDALLPEFSKNPQANIKKAALFAMILGAVLSGGLFLSSDLLMRYTYGFLQAIPLLKLLSISLFFLSFNLILEAALLANKFEKYVNKSLIAGLIFSILGFSLFNRYGAFAAAISYILGDSLVMIFFLLKLFYKKKSI